MALPGVGTAAGAGAGGGIIRNIRLVWLLRSFCGQLVPILPRIRSRRRKFTATDFVGYAPYKRPARRMYAVTMAEARSANATSISACNSNDLNLKST